MKKFLQLSALFLVTILYGQKISDYQYIYVPDKFSDFEPNKYDLNNLLELKLKQKKYFVLRDDKENWLLEILQNPCRYLTADITDTSNMFKNRLKVQFKDCQNKTVESSDGNSSIKDYEPGMRQALEVAVKTLAISTPVEKIMNIQKVELTESNKNSEMTNRDLPEVPETKRSQITPTSKLKAAATKNEELYSSGKLILNKILLTNGEFVLVIHSSSTPYATFKPSTKKDVYRVKLPDGTKTIGYLENNQIVIEWEFKDGTLTKQILLPK